MFQTAQRASPLPVPPVPEGLLELPDPGFRPHIFRFEAGLAFDLPLRRLSTVSGAIDGALAVRLSRLRRSRSFLRLGYARFGDYARERLDLAERTAYDLARLGGRLEELPVLASALREGRFGWTAASEVARVARRDDEAAWVAKAERLSLRKLRDEVRTVLAGRRVAKAAPASAGADEEREAPASHGDSTSPADAAGLEVDALGRQDPDRRGRPGPWPDWWNESWIADELGPVALHAGLPAETRAALRLLEAPVSDDPFALDESLRSLVRSRSALDLDLARLRREVAWAEGRDRMGRVRGFPLPPPPGQLVTALDEMTEALGEGVWPMFATREDEWVFFELRLRRLAFPLWREARRQVVLAGGKGHATDDSVIRSVALAFLTAYLPLWLAEIESGDPIAVRERFRCAVPGCTVRSGSAHHIRFRSHGGSDDPSNLTFLCYRHHLLGLHELGSLRVSGKAPDALRVELGIRPDGRPLEVFLGGEREEARGRAPAAPRRPTVPGSGPVLIPPRVSFPLPRPGANLGPCPPPP